MDPLTEPQVVLTHESDLDGLVSGLLLQRLARHLFGREVPLEAYHYQGWKARQLNERSAWVSDFTFEARLDRKGWLVVDHHATCHYEHDSTYPNEFALHELRYQTLQQHQAFVLTTCQLD